MNPAIQRAIAQRIQDLRNYCAHVELFPEQVHGEPEREIVKAREQIQELRCELQKAA